MLALAHTHKHTHAPHSALVVNKQTAALAQLYLIYRTFVAVDIYRGSGAVNFMQTPLKRSMPRARGLLSRRHHKSSHAEINQFNWTPSTGKETDGGGGCEDGESWMKGAGRRVGRGRGEAQMRGVDIQGIAGG